MKKIISILLMLSMVFSLVACSTEPASDVVDNSVVSGEGLENVSTNGNHGGDLGDYSYLLDVDWQSVATLPDARDYYELIGDDSFSIKFSEDGTVKFSEDGEVTVGYWVLKEINDDEKYCWIQVIIEDITYDTELYDGESSFRLSNWDNNTGFLFESDIISQNEYHGTIWRTEKVLHSDTEEEYTNNYKEIEFSSASEARADVDRHVLYGMNDEYIDAGSGHRFVYTIEEDGVLFDNGVVTFKALLEGDYLVFDDGIYISYYTNQTEQIKEDRKFFDESFYKMTWYSMNEEVVENNSLFHNSILDFSEDGTVKWTIDNDVRIGTWVRTHFDIGIYEMEFDGETYEVYQGVSTIDPRDPGRLSVDDTYKFDIEPTQRTYCKLSETVWEISALEDKNGNRTTPTAPLAFEFTSETGGKFTQPEKIDNVALDKEIGETLLNIDSLSGLTENLILTGEFFEKYNNDGSDKAEVTITENEMIISTDVQNFVFDYSGVRATTVLQDMSLVLYSVFDERITFTSDFGEIYLYDFMVSNNRLKLFLGADGTAELSNGAETLTGTWNYDDVLIGPNDGHINISSDVFDIESNPEFFADLLTELKNIDGQIEWSVDSSLDAYPGNVTSEEIWFDLGETRFSFVQDPDFNHFATIDNSFN